ncbi:MAG TPA: universal stress protein [Gaiellaceae bacterium]|nr:universal stress protein [Gaiellaceae bacterium]
MIVLTIVLGAAVVILSIALYAATRPPKVLRRAARARRILVPFTGTSLDPTVLQAAIRIASAEEAVLVPAYLLIVPLEYPEDSALQKEVAVAMPLLEAVEHAALRAGVPVDARIEKGRTPTHALRRLWEAESFDRLVVPARAGGHDGFNPKELAWLLTHAPTETVVLRPSPNGADLLPRRKHIPSRRRRRALAAAAH